MAATVRIDVNIAASGGGKQVIDDLTLGFFQDLERAQETGKMKDFIPVLAGLLGVDRAAAREVTMRQWQQIAAAMREAATVPPTSA